MNRELAPPLLWHHIKNEIENKKLNGAIDVKCILEVFFVLVRIFQMSLPPFRKDVLCLKNPKKPDTSLTVYLRFFLGSIPLKLKAMLCSCDIV